MFTKSPLRLAIAAVMAAPICAQAEVTVSAEIKNETAFWLDSDQATGEARTMLDEGGHDSGDVMKFENSARIFINGDVGEDSSWHLELRPVYDTEAPNEDLKGHKLYSQNDYLREAYVDTSAGDWDLRLGKQQVVWGTADGIKLLDIINPTDFRELNQNAVEDARIPVWMANAEYYFENGSNLQLIVSQAEENKFAGLNSDGDSGSPFIAKGVDAITGQVNGFLNITPQLAATAQTFTNGAPLLANVFNTAFPGLGLPAGAGLVPFAGFTVDGFSNTPFSFDPNVGIPSLQVGSGAGVDVQGYQLLSTFAQCGFDATCSGADPNANQFVTNLMPANSTNPFDTSWNPNSDRESAFEHLPLATFATFNTFSGNVVMADLGFGMQPVGVPGSSATTRYERDYPDDENVNFGGRFRNSLDNGLNFSVNYFYGYDSNPAVDLDWHDRNTGEKLQVVRAGTQPNGSIDPVNDNRSRAQIASGLAAGSTTSVLLRNGAGAYYGAFDPTTGAVNANTNPVELRFTESVHRTHNIGASFDYAFDTELAPVVLRGEFLYKKDTRQPVVDNLLLGIGDLSNGLTSQKADMFNYVIGVDVTVMTNLLVSGQFIQFRNLDYVDKSETCNVTYAANPLDPVNTAFQRQYDCSRYTADAAVLNPTNGLEKARENKEFYSLFLSKPFGPNQLGRVNNIIIFEEGGGYWNRLDAEYSLSDQLIVGGELNMYWGDEETQFGQFENSSNIQFTVKYIIE